MANSSSIKNKSISGIIWNAMQRFGTMGIAFISNIVLARLLSPDDFGCIGMLLIFTAVANTFVDGGFGSALIQKKQPTQADYSTVFYTNLGISLLLYGLLYLSAPAIASFYKIPLLCSVLRAQGLVIIIMALCIVQNNILRKNLLFKKLAVINIIANCVSVTIAIVMAYMGYGVWSLVAQNLITPFATMTLLWITSHWKLTLEFSKKSFKELFGFGSFILFSNLLNSLCNNIQGLLIGKFFSPAIMGMYTQARKLEEVASTSISSVIDTVSYPVLSSVQNDLSQLKNAIRKFILLLAYVCFPLMALLALIAKPLIIFLYSEKWIECIPYFQILCIAGIAVCLQGINYYGVAAIGKSKDLFNWTIVKRLLGIGFIVAGMIWFGIYGLLVGCVLTSFTIYIVNSYLVSKHIGYKLLSQFVDLLPTIFLTAIVSLIVMSVPFFFHFNIYATGVMQTAIFLGSYIFLSSRFKMEAFFTFKSIWNDLVMKRLKGSNPAMELKNQP